MITENNPMFLNMPGLLGELPLAPYMTLKSRTFPTAGEHTRKSVFSSLQPQVWHSTQWCFLLTAYPRLTCLKQHCCVQQITNQVNVPSSWIIMSLTNASVCWASLSHKLKQLVFCQGPLQPRDTVYRPHEGCLLLSQDAFLFKTLLTDRSL